jgi:membrane protease subunit HflK
MKRLFQGWSWEHWYNLAREDIDEAFNSVRRAARVGLYVGLALWVLSGFHAVRQNEVGLTTYFGKLSRGQENPGLRYRLPWPMGSVRRVPVQTQQRVTIGFSGAGISADERLGIYDENVLATSVASQIDKTSSDEDSELDKLMAAGHEKQMGERRELQMGTGLAVLTSDHNVILLQAVVQFIIRDPKRFVYGSEDVPLMLKRMATKALVLEAAKTQVDDLLTTARSEVQSRVREAVQDEANAIDLGVQVAGVELQRVVPPQAVAAAFRDVNDAREDMNTRQNEAEQYRNTIVPQAKGDADKMVREAEAYREQRIAEARGESSKFQGVLREFINHGSLTAERLRLEALERIMPKVNKVQVGSSPAEAPGIELWVPDPGDQQ